MKFSDKLYFFKKCKLNWNAGGDPLSNPSRELSLIYIILSLISSFSFKKSILSFGIIINILLIHGIFLNILRNEYFNSLLCISLSICPIYFLLRFLSFTSIYLITTSIGSFSKILFSNFFSISWYISINLIFVVRSPANAEKPDSQIAFVVFSSVSSYEIKDFLSFNFIS